MLTTAAEWFESVGRDLPWRRTRDPWAVLVSELMLQQTGVARVLPKYEAFVHRFPDAGACAAATVGDVVSMWQGLGYNRRAVNVHRCATVVVAEHGGQLPTTLDELTALPGIGPYTARAVLAFAHEQPIGILDVNVTRTLSRVLGQPVSQEEADALAAAASDAWKWNQAVMELGEVKCRARPRCDECPVASACAWRLAGGTEPDPWARPPRQSRFEGSDRQGRGRLVDSLRHGPVAAPDLPAVMGWPDDPVRAERVAQTLLTDGLAVLDPTNAAWTLP